MLSQRDNLMTKHIQGPENGANNTFFPSKMCFGGKKPALEFLMETCFLCLYDKQYFIQGSLDFYWS